MSVRWMRIFGAIVEAGDTIPGSGGVLPPLATPSRNRTAAEIMAEERAKQEAATPAPVVEPPAPDVGATSGAAEQQLANAAKVEGKKPRGAFPGPSVDEAVARRSFEAVTGKDPDEMSPADVKKFSTGVLNREPVPAVKALQKELNVWLRTEPAGQAFAKKYDEYMDGAKDQLNPDGKLGPNTRAVLKAYEEWQRSRPPAPAGLADKPPAPPVPDAPPAPPTAETAPAAPRPQQPAAEAPAAPQPKQPATEAPAAPAAPTGGAAAPAERPPAATEPPSQTVQQPSPELQAARDKLARFAAADSAYSPTEKLLAQEAMLKSFDGVMPAKEQAAMREVYVDQAFRNDPVGTVKLLAKGKVPVDLTYQQRAEALEKVPVDEETSAALNEYVQRNIDDDLARGQNVSKQNWFEHASGAQLQQALKDAPPETLLALGTETRTAIASKVESESLPTADPDGLAFAGKLIAMNKQVSAEVFRKQVLDGDKAGDPIASQAFFASAERETVIAAVAGASDAQLAGLNPITRAKLVEKLTNSGLSSLFSSQTPEEQATIDRLSQFGI